MFIAECVYQTTLRGPIFLPPDCESDHPCELHVDIDVLSYEPAEPDVGAGPTFGWKIEAIWIVAHRWGGPVKQLKRRLDERGDAAARLFIETYYADELAEHAIHEAAEAYGVSHQVAA